MRVGARNTRLPAWFRNETRGILPTIVLSLLLFFTALPALGADAATAKLGPPFQVGVGTPVYGPALTEQRSPAVAFDGTNHLVVWEDGGAVRGARVSADGTLLDSVSIPIMAGTDPAVVFNGSNYFVVSVVLDWATETTKIRCSRVNTSGVVLDPDGITIVSWGALGGPVALAFDGTNHLLAWMETHDRWDPGDPWDPVGDVHAMRVDSTGAPLDPSGILLSSWSLSGCQIIISPPGEPPAVGFDGSNYVVVWEQENCGNASKDIRASRVTPSGAVLDPGGIDIAATQDYHQLPSVAFDGTNFLVVYSKHSAGAWEEMDIYGSRMSPSGTVLDPGGFPISTASKAQSTPAISFDGTNYLIAWSDTRNSAGPNAYLDTDIYGARVSVLGEVLDMDGVAISTAWAGQTSASVAFGEADYLIAWEDGRGSTSDIYGARVSPSLSVLEPEGRAIATGQAVTNRQTLPAAASNGREYLAVWEDYRRGFRQVFGSRMTSSGAPLDPEGIAVSARDCQQRKPAVASDGHDYFVVWEDTRNGALDIYGARVSASGAVLDTAAIAVSTAAGDQSAPRAAFDGVNFLVVWTDGPASSSQGGAIRGARVSPSGVVLDTAGIAISAALADQRDPAVAFDGQDYLVVWADWRGIEGESIRGARLSRSGAVLGTSEIVVSAGAATSCARTPALAFDGENYLVIWSNGGSNVYRTRVSRSGTVLDTPSLSAVSRATIAQAPVVAFDGTDYLVLWHEAATIGPGIGGTRLSTTACAREVYGTRASTAVSATGVYGTRVSTAGVALDPGGIPLVTGEHIEEGPPGIGRGPGGALLIVYEAYTPEPYQTNRIWGNLWQEAALVPGTLNGNNIYASPNPFNPDVEAVSLRFRLRTPGDVTIKVYDTSNTLVSTVISGHPMSADADLEVRWNGKNDREQFVSNGVYLYVIESSSGERAVGKVAVLR